MSIPKIIHYCWFGRSEKDDLTKKYINTWKKILPDYEFKEWNESNFNININKYVFEAYNNKKWAFVSDYVRIWALYNQGGIYLDTDVEVIKNFEDLLESDLFFGLEQKGRVSTAVIGAKRKNNFLKDILNYYDTIRFEVNGVLNQTPNTIIISEMLYNKGLDKEQQENCIIDNSIYIYSQEYFSPKDPLTNVINRSNNTYAIHYFSASWQGYKYKIKLFIKRIFIRFVNLKGINNNEC